MHIGKRYWKDRVLNMKLKESESLVECALSQGSGREKASVYEIEESSSKVERARIITNSMLLRSRQCCQVLPRGATRGAGVWRAGVSRPSGPCASFYSTLPRTHQQLLQGDNHNGAMTVRGLIRSVRSSKTVAFIDIADGTLAQVVNVVARDGALVLAKHKLKVGQSIEVSGQWQESQGRQASELVYDPGNPEQSLTVVGDVPDTYPLQKKTHTLGFLRGLPTLRHRTSTLASILRFRSRVESTLASVFEENHFIKVSPPIITSTDCEGAGEQFGVEPPWERMRERGGEGVKDKEEVKETEEVKDKEGQGVNDGQETKSSFFGAASYLTVSSQLHLEVLAASLNRVWTLSPCFRAEYSNTTRHLSEFWMLEAEICHVTDVHELVHFTESLIRGVVTKLKSLNPSDTGSLQDLTNSRYAKDSQILSIWDGLLGQDRWPCITYTEAVDILNSVKAKGRLKGRLAWGDSILTEHEKWLAGSHFKSPVFITDYPKHQKPFYMPLSKGVTEEHEHKTVACFDLIVPEIGELVGGSMREHDLARLKREMERRKMDLDGMQWYLSLRENGSVPHGGFGMGFERLLAYLSHTENIRDISAFPRAPNVCPC